MFREHAQGAHLQKNDEGEPDPSAGEKTTLLTTVLRSRTGIRVGLKTRKGIWEPIITGNEQNRLISRNVPERNDYLPIT